MGRLEKPRRLARFAPHLSVAAIALVLGGCSASRIGDIAGADITKTANTGLSALLGLQTPEQKNEQIQLYARSPLVLPPDYNLRPPETEEQQQQQLGAEWPDDPDERARRLAQEAEKGPQGPVDHEAIKGRVGRSDALSQEQLASGRVPPGQQAAYNPNSPEPIHTAGNRGTSAPGTYRVGDQNVGSSAAMSPDELLKRRQQQAEVGQQQSQTGPAATPPGPFGSSQADTQQVAEAEEPRRRGFFSRLFGR
jgi:hypothetical protein